MLCMFSYKYKHHYEYVNNAYEKRMGIIWNFLIFQYGLRFQLFKIIDSVSTCCIYT